METYNADNRLSELSLKLPPAPSAMGIYRPFVQAGDLAYMSGHGPWLDNGTFIKGRIGLDIVLEEAKQAARQTGLAILATLKENLGSLENIQRVIKIFGMVNSTPEFHKHPYVINGCSELFAEVFGPENGIGVRSAVGVGSLPDNIPVEIEAIFQLK